MYDKNAHFYKPNAESTSQEIIDINIRVEAANLALFVDLLNAYLGSRESTEKLIETTREVNMCGEL